MFSDLCDWSVESVSFGVDFVEVLSLFCAMGSSADIGSSNKGAGNRLPVEKSPFVPKVEECYPDVA
ncbi:hypothetical protein LR48_Vigan10g184000 [Vigna angularis]|uniref:Uncharacterized protein n=1 Tax=Phaseolus angularis TaxID=3914 RepID=A0A0L9VLW1_PHAAN|nr:hypothetical protein LR48_Vigan10g184000 [Vigna angularis]